MVGINFGFDVGAGDVAHVTLLLFAFSSNKKPEQG